MYLNGCTVKDPQLQAVEKIIPSDGKSQPRILELYLQSRRDHRIWHLLLNTIKIICLPEPKLIRNIPPQNMTSQTLDLIAIIQAPGHEFDTLNTVVNTVDH